MRGDDYQQLLDEIDQWRNVEFDPFMHTDCENKAARLLESSRDAITRLLADAVSGVHEP